MKAFLRIVPVFAACLILCFAPSCMAGGSPPKTTYYMKIKNNSHTSIVFTSGYYQQNCKNSSGNYDINVSGSASSDTTKKFSYKVNDSCDMRVARVDAYPKVSGYNREYGLYFKRFGKGNGTYTITDSDIKKWKNGQNIIKESY